jgi:hypothetical protein
LPGGLVAGKAGKDALGPCLSRFISIRNLSRRSTSSRQRHALQSRPAMARRELLLDQRTGSIFSASAFSNYLIVMSGERRRVSAAVVFDYHTEWRTAQNTRGRFSIAQKKTSLLFFAKFKTRLEHI